MNWILILCPDLGRNFGMIQNVGKVSSMYPNPLGSSSNKEYNLGPLKWVYHELQIEMKLTNLHAYFDRDQSTLL